MLPCGFDRLFGVAGKALQCDVAQAKKYRGPEDCHFAAQVLQAVLSLVELVISPPGSAAQYIGDIEAVGMKTNLVSHFVECFAGCAGEGMLFAIFPGAGIVQQYPYGGIRAAFAPN